ncbi:lysophospholipid acyltransferase family protein [Streptomyces sp. NBC_00162]|uniref:lysophospholipid acyltransferase family protein n=1 Tax=Streptomyces sp. NBC_00162 TaxID=2903629 RepID=UPI00214B7C1F|nr:lysophospholipid acyltransferase family protein [Streptomyces sp. NBC_00162]UUU38772.1 1-acyl-sn-glycerol-3-phosphate acyltransferase [Streptomyces sp. NBC_00162]
MSVWLPTSPCTPEACAGHEGRTASIPLAVLRLVAAVFLILAGILGAPPVRLLPAGPRHAVVRAWSAALVRAFGIRITVHGSPGQGGGRLIVANHISWLDIPLVAAVMPCRMLAKSDIRAWPVLGRLAGQSGTLFIERERIRALPATVETMTRALLAGDRVTVFPEGSTWCGRAQGPFRRAAFQSALDARVPVQPIRLAYLRCDGDTAGEPAFVGDDPLTASLWRIARARGVRAEVTLLPRIPPGRYADRRDLAAAAQTAITSAASLPGIPTQRSAPSATDKDSAKRPAASVHHWTNSSPADASSLRTPS